jgi:hypothetical protein
MLSLSARSGALAQRVGPRIPLSVGPLVIAAGMLRMTRIDPSDSYASSVLPAVIVFGLGLALVVAPVSATALAATDARHAGIASGINNAIARVAGLLVVAVLPLIAGLIGDDFYDPTVIATTCSRSSPRCAESPRSRSRPTSGAIAGPPLRPASEPAGPHDPRRTHADAWLGSSYNSITPAPCTSTCVCRSATRCAPGRPEGTFAGPGRATPRRAR